MKFLQFTIAATVALAFSGAALTQTAGAPPPAQIDAPTALGALDTNRDGSVSLDEAGTNPALTRQFMRLDQNQNGALEPAEFARFETLGAATTRGTPGAPGTPAGAGGTSPGSGAGVPAPGSAAPPSGSTPAPAGTSPAPSGASPAPSGSTAPAPGGNTGSPPGR